MGVRGAAVGANDLSCRLLPIAVDDGREFDFEHDQLDDPVEHRLLARHVAIQRHRLDTEFVPESPHRQRLKPFGVDDRERGFQDPAAVESALSR